MQTGRERLRPLRRWGTTMRVLAEVLPTHREESVELNPESTGLDLLRALQLAPDAYVLIREETPIPADAPLLDGERVRLIRIVSGGSGT